MEPNLPEVTPLASPEQGYQPQAGSVSAESTPNVAPERPHEVMPIAAPQQTSATTDSVQYQVPSQQSSVPSVASPVPVGLAVDDPVIADDVDVIEKEWVDKAKRIVASTKDDPFQQEKQVSQLQADYLMKRYNKEVKLSE